MKQNSFPITKGKESMKESNNTLNSLLETLKKAPIPYWAKTTIAVSAGITPLIDKLVPLIVLAIIMNSIRALLGF